MSKKSAKSASAVEDVQEGEVALSTVSPAQEEGLANGLGMEKFLPAPKSKRVEPSKPTKVAPVTAPQPTQGVTEAVTAAPTEDAEEAESTSENPEIVKLNKRLKDTRDYATREANKNLALERQVKSVLAEMSVLKAKMDGTYTEPPQPTAEDIAKRQLIAEKVRVSRAVAEQLYGVDYVKKTIFDDGSPYLQLEQSDPLVWARVSNALQPTLEAIQVLKEHQFFTKYGRDPDKIVAQIRQEANDEIVDEIKTKVKVKPTGETVRGVGSVRSAVDRAESGKAEPATQVSLKSIFTGFPTGHE